MSSATMLKNAYQIGIITALPIERAAITAMLDVLHEKPDDFIQASHDANCYTWGRIGLHNVVIASLSAGVYGNTMATTTAMDMLWSFQNIKFGLMVGIGAGVPRQDIRLGDVVVSQPSGLSGGVFQYDLGKARHNEWERRDFLARPPDILLKALNKLQTEHEFQSPRAHEHLRAAISKHPYWGTLYGRPGIDDQLFLSSYLHHIESFQGTCSACDISKIIKRPHRIPNDDFKIHYGVIASGNALIKNAELRDWIARMEQDCACIEMEAAGLMNNFPCLVIRGICDYADSHKNDAWQRYACATAAAFSKELLGFVPVTDSKAIPEAVDISKIPKLEQVVAPSYTEDEPQPAGLESSPQYPPFNRSTGIEEPISTESAQEGIFSTPSGSITTAIADPKFAAGAVEIDALDEIFSIDDSNGLSRIERPTMFPNYHSWVERPTTSPRPNRKYDVKLLEAAKKGDIRVMASLLKYGADVETMDTQHGNTSLLLAVRQGHLDTVRLLIKHNASVDAYNKYGSTPLSLAAENGHLGIVRLLIEHNANVNAANTLGYTPLYHAAASGHLEVVRLLIEHNANVNTADRDGYTLLYFAARRGDLDMARLLIEHNASVNAINNLGTTPLYHAAASGYLEVVKLLIQHNANVDASDVSGDTPLRCATMQGYQEVAKYLIEHDANIDKPNNGGWTPLSTAVNYDMPNMVRLLLEHGATTTTKGPGGTALDVARQRRYTEIVRLLEAHASSKETQEKSSWGLPGRKRKA